MILPAPPLVLRKRRGREKRKPPYAPVALMVVGIPSAGVYEITLDVEVQFNVTEGAPLANVSGADPAKWTARYQGTRYVGSMLQNYEFDKLYLVMAPAGLEAGTNELSYSNAPSDISDALGRQLAAFSGMALP